MTVEGTSAPPPTGASAHGRACPKCGATEDSADSVFCPHCGAVLKVDAARSDGPHSQLPHSEAPDTEQTGEPRFSLGQSAGAIVDDKRQAPFLDESSKTIAEDGEPASLRHARASGLEKPVPTPSEAEIIEAPLMFSPAPERLSAPESWLRSSADIKAALLDAEKTSLDAKPPVEEPPGPPPKPDFWKVEKTVEDLDDDAKRALKARSGAASASDAPKKPEPLAKGTTAPHLLPGSEAVEKMLKIRATPALPIALAQHLGRLILVFVLSAAAAIGFGFLREAVGADLVKALSLDPRGPVLNVAFGALYVLTSFAFAYGVFQATSRGWRRPKWGKV